MRAEDYGLRAHVDLTEARQSEASGPDTHPSTVTAPNRRSAPSRQDCRHRFLRVRWVGPDWDGGGCPDGWVAAGVEGGRSGHPGGVKVLLAGLRSGKDGRLLWLTADPGGHLQRFGKIPQFRTTRLPHGGLCRAAGAL